MHRFSKNYKQKFSLLNISAILSVNIYAKKLVFFLSKAKEYSLHYNKNPMNCKTFSRVTFNINNMQKQYVVSHVVKHTNLRN